MRSGDRPGLQNRRAAGLPVAGGFDPHSLPPFFGSLRIGKSVANQFGLGGAISPPSNALLALDTLDLFEPMIGEAELHSVKFRIVHPEIRV